MSKQTRRSSNINDLLRRKGASLKSDSPVDIVDQIAKVTEPSTNITTKKKKSKLKGNITFEGAVGDNNQFGKLVEPGKYEKDVESKDILEGSIQASVEQSLDEEVGTKNSFDRSSKSALKTKIGPSKKEDSSSDLLVRYKKVLRLVKPGLAMQYFVLFECASESVLSMSRREMGKVLNITENSVRIVVRSLRASGLLKIEVESSAGVSAVYRCLF